MSNVGNIAIGAAVLGSLGIILLIVNKFSKIDLIPDLSGLNPFKMTEEMKKKTLKRLTAIQFEKNGSWSLGNTEKERVSKARQLAQIIQNRLTGLSNYKDFAMVVAMFKRLKYKNDIILLVKKFGIRGGQTLFQWINNESGMTEADKNYLTNRIIKAVN